MVDVVFTAFVDVLAIKKCKTAMDQLFQNKSDNRNIRTVHLSERLIDEFALVKVCGRTIALYQVFFQQGRVALGK